MKTLIKSFFLVISVVALLALSGQVEHFADYFSDDVEADELSEETTDIEITETNELKKETKDIEIPETESDSNETITVKELENDIEEQQTVMISDSDEEENTIRVENEEIKTDMHSETLLYEEEHVSKEVEVIQENETMDTDSFLAVTNALISNREGFAIHDGSPLTDPIKILANDEYKCLTQALGASYNIWGYGCSELSISCKKLRESGSSANLDFDIALEDGSNSKVICKILYDDVLVDGFEIEDSAAPHHMSIDLNNVDILKIELENTTGNYTRTCFYDFEIR